MHRAHAHVIFIAIEAGTNACTNGWLFECAQCLTAHLKPYDRKCAVRHHDKMPHRMHYTQKSVLSLARHCMQQRVLNILKWLDAEAMQFATHFVHPNVIQYSASNHIRYSPNVLFYIISSCF